jgi:hypothetical protein
MAEGGGGLAGVSVYALAGHRVPPWRAVTILQIVNTVCCAVAIWGRTRARRDRCDASGFGTFDPFDRLRGPLPVPGLSLNYKNCSHSGHTCHPW